MCFRPLCPPEGGLYMNQKRIHRGNRHKLQIVDHTEIKCRRSLHYAREDFHGTANISSFFARGIGPLQSPRRAALFGSRAGQH